MSTDSMLAERSEANILIFVLPAQAGIHDNGQQLDAGHNNGRRRTAISPFSTPYSWRRVVDDRLRGHDERMEIDLTSFGQFPRRRLI